MYILPYKYIFIVHTYNKAHNIKIQVYVSHQKENSFLSFQIFKCSCYKIKK
jgi:hypothetical protein